MLKRFWKMSDEGLGTVCSQLLSVPGAFVLLWEELGISSLGLA